MLRIVIVAASAALFVASTTPSIAQYLARHYFGPAYAYGYLPYYGYAPAYGYGYMPAYGYGYALPYGYWARRWERHDPRDTNGY
jgi:hypothetical protein